MLPGDFIFVFVLCFGLAIHKSVPLGWLSLLRHCSGLQCARPLEEGSLGRITIGLAYIVGLTDAAHSKHSTKTKIKSPDSMDASKHISFNLCRISDRGGGIPHDKMSKVMLYNFSTAEESINQAMQGDIFGGFMEEVNRSTSGPMHG